MKIISPQEFQQKIKNGGNFFLLDVREPFEHKAKNLGGTLIPLGEIITRVKEIPTEKEVIVYCRKGIRSQIAIQRLEGKFGFTNLVNLTGGIEAFGKI